MSHYNIQELPEGSGSIPPNTYFNAETKEIRPLEELEGVIEGTVTCKLYDFIHVADGYMMIEARGYFLHDLPVGSYTVMFVARIKLSHLEDAWHYIKLPSVEIKEGQEDDGPPEPIH